MMSLVHARAQASMSTVRRNVLKHVSASDAWFSGVISEHNMPQILNKLMQGSHAVLKYWKSIEFWNQFSRPWKSIEFGQNVHKVLENYGNSKCSHLFIQTLFFTADDSSAAVFFALCSMNRMFDNEAK